jgi:hypothetical protein
MTDGQHPSNQNARKHVLAYLERQPDWVLDMVSLLAHAMEREQRYVLCIEVANSSSMQATNIDDARQLARFHERFARRARQDAAI